MSLSLKRVARFPARKPRAAVEIESWLLLPHDEVAAITIRNISADGFMAEAAAKLHPGTSFGIVIPGCGIVRATVRWHDEGLIGGQFRRPIDTQQLETYAKDGRGGGFLQPRMTQGPLGSLSSHSGQD
jgi:hypothetical protein